MNERELLTLAAQAAGIEGEYECWTGQGFKEGIRQVLNGAKCLMPWNPLTDDGDALRLAAKLEIQVRWRTSAVDAHAGKVSTSEHIETYGKMKATRRAIVRAAAELGRAA